MASQKLVEVKDFDEWLRESFKEEESDTDNKDGIIKVEESEKGLSSGILSVLKHLSEKITSEDRKGAQDMFQMVKKEFQTWVEGNSTFDVESKGSSDDLIPPTQCSEPETEVGESSTFKAGDLVSVGVLVPMLEGDDYQYQEDPNVEYQEALLVRKGYLMPRGWEKEEALPAKKKRMIHPDDDTPVQVLEEYNFRPSQGHQKITTGNIPNWNKQHGALEEYREVAERTKAECEQENSGKMKKSDVESEGAGLLPIWKEFGGCCGGGYGEGGSYLWADLCVWNM